MANIIIVDGIDRVGKSTLCQMLKEDFNFPIIKYDSKIIKVNERTNDYESDKTLLTLELCNSFDVSVIFDRLYFSDFVYGIIQREYDYKKAKYNFELIEKYINDTKNNVFLIIVVSTDIKRSSIEHGKNLSKHEQMFIKLFSDSTIKNKMICNYNNLEETISFIKNNIE